MIFRAGHLMVRWYGLIVMAAIAAGVWVASREATQTPAAMAAITIRPYQRTIRCPALNIIGSMLMVITPQVLLVYVALHPTRTVYERHTGCKRHTVLPAWTQ